MRLLRFSVLVFAVLLALGVDAQEQPLPADVRVVIDISGSMKQNDPNNLRQPALELLVQLIPDGSKAGVWTFGQYINMLVPHKPVDSAWRENAKLKASEISSLGLYTNIGGALTKAAYDRDSQNNDYRTSVILLTDGMVDIDKSPEKNQAEWRRIVDQVLPDLQAANYTLHTIALSDNADTALMDKLALGTDGIAAVAKSAEELMSIFLKALDQAAPAEQVPLEGDRFVIDSSVEEFTALIFRKPGSDPSVLISPDRTRYSFEEERSDVSWYRTEKYDLITLKQPLEGEWRLQADILPDSRVTVVSNLNLLVKPLPSNLFVGDSAALSLLLQEDGKTLQRAEFLRLIDIDANASFSNASGPVGDVWNEDLSGDLPPGNGIYSAGLDIFSAPGDYQLQVLVDGKSFQRQFLHNFSVREPFGVALKKEVVDSSTEHLLIVTAFGDDVDLIKTKVVAKVKDPQGRTSIKPLQLSAQDNWQLRIIPEFEGEYKLALRVNGIDNKGKKFGFNPEPIKFRYPDADDPFAAAESEPVVEPEPLVEVVPEPVVEVIAQPVIEQQPKPDSKVVDPEKVVEAVEEPIEEIPPEEPQWLLYGLLAGGNIVILVLAFFAYRMIMGGKKDDSLEALEKSIEEVEEKPASAAKKPPVEDVEPTMDSAGIDDAEPESTSGADDLVSGGLDISDDAALDEGLDLNKESTPEPTEAPAAEDDPFADMDSGGDDADDDLSFSMDDFSDIAADDEDDKDEK